MVKVSLSFSSNLKLSGLPIINKCDGNLYSLIKDLTGSCPNFSSLLQEGSFNLKPFLRISVNNQIVPVSVTKDSEKLKGYKIRDSDKIHFFSAVAGG